MRKGKCTKYLDSKDSSSINRSMSFPIFGCDSMSLDTEQRLWVYLYFQHSGVISDVHIAMKNI